MLIFILSGSRDFNEKTVVKWLHKWRRYLFKMFKNTVVKRVDSKPNLLGLKSNSFHLFLYSWTGQLTSLFFCFFICKIELIIMPTLVVVRSELINENHLEQYLSCIKNHLNYFHCVNALKIKLLYECNIPCSSTVLHWN